MTADKDFLDAIIANPDDDARRLVYADWLEEHGDTARAEFIRVQCALARLSPLADEAPALRRREAELLAAHRESWDRIVAELPGLSALSSAPSGAPLRRLAGRLR